MLRLLTLDFKNPENNKGVVIAAKENKFKAIWTTLGERDFYVAINQQVDKKLKEKEISQDGIYDDVNMKIITGSKRHPLASPGNRNLMVTKIVAPKGFKINKVEPVKDQDVEIVFGLTSENSEEAIVFSDHKVVEAGVRVEIAEIASEGGYVFEYDIDPEYVYSVEDIVRDCNVNKVTKREGFTTTQLKIYKKSGIEKKKQDNKKTATPKKDEKKDVKKKRELVHLIASSEKFNAKALPVNIATKTIISGTIEEMKASLEMVGQNVKKSTTKTVLVACESTATLLAIGVLGDHKLNVFANGKVMGIEEL